MLGPEIAITMPMSATGMDMRAGIDTALSCIVHGAVTGDLWHPHELPKTSYEKNWLRGVL
jgi:hypothetical protein